MYLVHTEASLGWGGQEIRILNESEGMLARGHRVTLLCPQDAKIYAEAKTRGLDVVPLPIGRKNVRGLKAMFSWLKHNRCDVINTHSSTDSWLAALTTKIISPAVPIVRTRHISSAIPDNMATRWLYNKRTKHIVTTGQALRRQLIEQNGFAAEKITSVPTGIDTDYFIPGDKQARRAELNLPQNKSIIGIVATLRSWKGHRYLLDALLEMSDLDVYLVIVGDGPQRVALEQQIINLGLDDRVNMVGNQRNVLPWLQALDIFTLPSYANEGVPQAILQAMSCGLPVITTPVGSILEVVEHDQTGLIVPPQDAKALSVALRQLLLDPIKANALAHAARKEAQAKFGIEFMLQEMESIFLKVSGHG